VRRDRQILDELGRCHEERIEAVLDRAVADRDGQVPSVTKSGDSAEPSSESFTVLWYVKSKSSTVSETGGSCRSGVARMSGEGVVRVFGTHKRR